MRDRFGQYISKEKAVTWTDEEVEKMRGQLAKMWRQSKSRVTDTEARFYLDLEAELMKAEGTTGTDMDKWL